MLYKLLEWYHKQYVIENLYHNMHDTNYDCMIQIMIVWYKLWSYDTNYDRMIQIMIVWVIFLCNFVHVHSLSDAFVVPVIYNVHLQHKFSDLQTFSTI